MSKRQDKRIRQLEREVKRLTALTAMQSERIAVFDRFAKVTATAVIDMQKSHSKLQDYVIDTHEMNNSVMSIVLKESKKKSVGEKIRNFFR